MLNHAPPPSLQNSSTPGLGDGVAASDFQTGRVPLALTASARVVSIPAPSAGLLLPSVAMAQANASWPLSAAALAAKALAALSYSWAWQAVPVTSALVSGATLAPTAGADALGSTRRSFIPDTAGSFAASVTVTDSCASASTSALAVVGPRLPWVYAGGSYAVVLTGTGAGVSVMLSRAQYITATGRVLFAGSQTFAADAAAAGVVFSWTVASAPAAVAAGTVMLTSSTQLAAAVFTPPAAGSYTLRVREGTAVLPRPTFHP